MTEPDPVARLRARAAADAALEKKGTDVVILDVGSVLGIIDLFVLVSAGNVRQVKSIVEEVELALEVHDDSRPLSVEGLGDASWVLVDYGDIVVHVFLEATRAFYDLDRLWGDVPRVEVVNAAAVQPAT